jgi:hypothetical protein
MKDILLTGLAVVMLIVLVFAVGIIFGKSSSEYEAAKIGAGFYTVNPTNGNTGFVWNTNTPAR